MQNKYSRFSILNMKNDYYMSIMMELMNNVLMEDEKITCSKSILFGTKRNLSVHKYRKYSTQFLSSLTSLEHF